MLDPDREFTGKLQNDTHVLLEAERTIEQFYPCVAGSREDNKTILTREKRRHMMVVGTPDEEVVRNA